MSTPQWLYDEIMRSIEPELVTDMLPTLDTIYAAETSEEHDVRMERYRLAYAAYDDALEQMNRYLFDSLQIEKTVNIRARRSEEEEEASSAISRIDQQLFSLSV